MKQIYQKRGLRLGNRRIKAKNQRIKGKIEGKGRKITMRNKNKKARKGLLF